GPLPARPRHHSLHARPPPPPRLRGRHRGRVVQDARGQDSWRPAARAPTSARGGAGRGLTGSPPMVIQVRRGGWSHMATSADFELATTASFEMAIDMVLFGHVAAAVHSGLVSLVWRRRS